MTTLAAHPASPSEPPTGGTALRHPAIAGAAVLAGLAFIAFAVDWLLKQNQFSSKHVSDWGHAYVVPIWSACMLWRVRGELARETVGVFLPGAALVAFGMVAYVFFVLQIPNHMLQGFSLIVSLYGLVLTAFGPGIARHAFLPIAFLGFAVTISEAVMLKLTFPLQILASKGAWVLLSIVFAPFGYSVDIDGNTLHILDDMGQLVAPMNVAEACSGMRMLIAFFAMGTGVALWCSKQWWQRVALVLLAIPVALLMNIVRVAVLGVLMLVDKELASGDAHMIVGTLLLIPALGVFWGVHWALQRITPDAEAAS